MALIVCPQCGNKISDKAEKCIFCNVKLKNNMMAYNSATAKYNNVTTDNNYVVNDYTSTNSYDNHINKERFIIVLVITLVASLVIFIGAFIRAKKIYKAGWDHAEFELDYYRDKLDECDRALRCYDDTLEMINDSLDDGKISDFEAELINDEYTKCGKMYSIEFRLTYDYKGVEDDIFDEASAVADQTDNYIDKTKEYLAESIKNQMLYEQSIFGWIRTSTFPKVFFIVLGLVMILEVAVYKKSRQ